MSNIVMVNELFKAIISHAIADFFMKWTGLFDLEYNTDNMENHEKGSLSF